MAKTRLTNCEVLDPETGERFWGWVEWEGETLTGVGRAGPGIEERKDPATRWVDARGCLLAPSFVDLFADFCEPGHEDREDIASGSAAAAAGGYTTVFVTPQTRPVCDGAETARFIMERGREAGLVDVRPLGATSRDLKGESLAAIGEMAEAGVIALSAGEGYEADAGFLWRVIAYAGNFGLRMVLTCEDPSLARGGMAHEGLIATTAGLPPIPAAAEEVAVARHVALCEATGVPLHLTRLSSAAGVRIVKDARARGLPITASVSALHLLLTEDAIRDYDTNAKVRPPLRSADDRKALIAALNDGTVDSVVSDHRPRARQEKEVEFERASPGASGIELTFSILNTLITAGETTLTAVVRALTLGPRRAMGIPGGRLAAGQPADVVLLDRGSPLVVTPEELVSRGKNTPLLGRTLTGRPVMTVRAGRVTWDRLGLIREASGDRIG